MRNEVFVFGLDNKFSKFENEIRKTAIRVLEILKKKGVLVEIYLVDAEKARFLNKKFRGKDKAADILSFEEPKNFVLPPLKNKKIGEIYLKFPIVDYPIEQLLAHGLLHLLGFHHDKKDDTIKMEKIERLLIEKLKK